jgi:hypothetical protein
MVFLLFQQLHYPPLFAYLFSMFPLLKLSLLSPPLS